MQYMTWLNHQYQNNHMLPHAVALLPQNMKGKIIIATTPKNSSKKSRLAIPLKFEGRVISILTEALLTVTKIKHFLTNATCLSWANNTSPKKTNHENISKELHYCSWWINTISDFSPIVLRHTERKLHTLRLGMNCLENKTVICKQLENNSTYCTLITITLKKEECHRFKGQFTFFRKLVAKGDTLELHFFGFLKQTETILSLAENCTKKYISAYFFQFSK